jgi:hypothetical protein
MRQRRREATANDPNSPKVQRCEGHLASVKMKPVIIFLFRSKSAELFFLLRQRRGAAGNDLGTTTKYLRRTTSGAEQQAAPRATACAPRSSTCDAQRASPRTTA